MGKFNCINRKSKEFKDLKTNLSKALGLDVTTVIDETLLDVIDLFVADNNITEVEALDRMEELSKYIEDYFGFNTKYTPDSDLQEQYDEWFNDNIDYINTPYTPTEETTEFEEEAKIITEEKARVINLSNGQRMVVIPNSLQFNKSFTPEQQKIIENLNPTSVEENKRLEDVEFVKKNYGEPLSYSFSERDGVTVGIRVKFEKGEIEVVPAAGVISRIKGKEIKYPHDIKYFIGVNKIIEGFMKKTPNGELISSSAKSSKFARQLTNPGNNLSVEYRGHTFRNAEHAYQTWKSGEFDEKAYKSKAFKPVGSKKVNTAVNFGIMVEIITAKLQQHPELIQGINERGGLDYILNSTHEVTGDKYWESSGENKFIEALAEAYKQVSHAHQTKSKSSKKKATLEDRVAEIEEMISAFDRTIIKDKDFAENHKYYIKTDKGSKLVDISVTALNAELLGEKFENKKGITYPQGHIGNSFDALVRDYFNGGITTQVYPNFNRRNIERLTRQLDKFVEQLDEAFGKGKYKVITKDWSLGGYVTVNGKKKSVAGSIDMMVVTESGDIYIYDMKTTSKDISSNINKYTGQLTFYKELISINYPEIAKRIKGVGLLVCDINFGRKFGSMNYGKYSIKKGTKDQLLFDGSEIQKEAGHINPVIQTNNTGIGGFILDLQFSQAVEDLKKHPLKMQKIETEEDFVAKETQKSILQKGGKKVEINNDDVDSLGTVKEIINTDADLCPVPDVEITYLGNAIVKLLSKYLDLLNYDDEARIKYLSNLDGSNDYAEDYFTSLDREQILTSDVFHKLLEYIKFTHFDPFDGTVEPDSELFNKLLWIQDNFNAIVNSGFATLINLEKVALTMSKDTSSEYENEDITRQFLEEEREESQQMAFDIDSKEKSYMDSIPAQLKTRLSKIYKMVYDEDGNPVDYSYDEYGYLLPTFEDKHYVVNTIMSLVHGCTSVSSMIEILQNNVSVYPWLNSVVEMLESSQMLKTQFFRTFRKNATLYNKLYIVKERDKNGDVTKVYYKSEPLTIKGKIDKIIGNLNVNIEANNVPLFDKVKTGVVSINEDEFEDFKENITKLSKVKNPTSKDIKTLRSILKSLGFDNIDNVKILKDEKYRKAFLDLVKSLGVLNSKLTTLNKKGKPFTYNSELNKSFYFISQSLSVAMNDEYEISLAICL